MLRTTLSTLLTCVLISLVGCESESEPLAPAKPDAQKAAVKSDNAAVKKPNNIVIVVLDTVRQDHLSTYGYERNTAPNLTAFSKYATMYNNAYATSCWTSPSHTSMFTGLYPSGHKTTQEKWHVEDSLTTLAEVLSKQGYQTVGVTGNAVVSSDAGFGQGFETYEESWRTKQGPKKRVQGRKQELPTQPRLSIDAYTSNWLETFFEERDDKRPLFLFINLIGAHTPYSSCGDNCGIYGAEVEGGIINNEWRDYYRGRRQMGEPDWTRLRNLYDAELREMDHHFGTILRTINANLKKKQTFIGVTSDHGENLGEHGHVSHVFSLHEPTTRIPMVLRHPEYFEKGGVSERPVQLVDLFSTALELANVSKIPKNHGHSLLRPPVDPNRLVLNEYFRPVQALASVEMSNRVEKQKMSKFDRRIKSLHQDGWKLHWGSDGNHELYHLEEDREELNDLVNDKAHQPRLEAMVRTLETLVKRYEGDAPELGDAPEMDEATRAELEALGYLGD
jgi:arylsulfatase A-like enzyme